MNRLKPCLLILSLLISAGAMAAAPSAPVNPADYKPPIRVACLGDSITHGVGAATGWSWSEQLDRMLGPDWDVRNYGHIRAKFDETVEEVETKVHDLESKIEEYDQQRMKYKHTQEESEKPLYGEYRKKIADTKHELAKYKNDMNMALVALVPAEYKGGFGAGWLPKYVSDRLAPIAASVTSEQRKQIREICRTAGPAYGKINNTPERSVEAVETYKIVYEQVLTPEQKKRVEPK